jgi:transposase-like protein
MGSGSRCREKREKIKPDRRKRQRKQRTGKKIVLLVALGFWEDGTRAILDWQMATSDEQTQWEGVVESSLDARSTTRKGLKMIVRDGCGGLEGAVALVYGKSVLDQRCVFHKLKNVGDKVRSELKGEEKREKRKEMMKQAKTIYQAPDVLQAKKQLQQWSEHWRQEAPKAVATLERDFEQTLVYYELDTVTPEWIRTTSFLERTNRELRRKFRQVVTFGSQIGAQVAVFLQVQRLHARWTHVPWWQVSHDLIFELGNINP